MKAASSPSFYKAMMAVVWKDLTAEIRSREVFSAMLVFALLVVLIFNFALDLEAGTRASITSGVLWVTFTFAGTLGLNRSMAQEKDRGCMDGLLMAPVDRSAIYMGKVIGNLVFMFAVEIVVIPVFSVLYNVNLINFGLIIGCITGFCWIYCCGYITGEYGSPDPHTRHAASDLIIPGGHTPDRGSG